MLVLETVPERINQALLDFRACRLTGQITRQISGTILIEKKVFPTVFVDCTHRKSRRDARWWKAEAVSFSLIRTSYSCLTFRLWWDLGWVMLVRWPLVGVSAAWDGACQGFMTARPSFGGQCTCRYRGVGSLPHCFAHNKSWEKSRGHVPGPFWTGSIPQAALTLKPGAC